MTAQDAFLRLSLLLRTSVNGSLLWKVISVSKQIKKLCEHDSVEKIDFAVSNVWSSDTCSIKFPLYTNFFYKLVNILWLYMTIDTNVINVTD